MSSALDHAPSRASARDAGGPRRRRRLRGRVLALVIGAVAAVTLLTVVLTVTTGGGGPSRPVNLQFAVPSAYHVTYLVTSPGAHPTSEELWVRSPFDSVDVTRVGPPPGGASSLMMVNRLGAQVLEASGAQPGLLHVPAASSPQAVRADAIVAAALRAGRLRVVGSQRVDGRRCTVFRSAAPLRSGPLTPLTASGPYTDTCIDAAGLVLRETTVTHGRVSTDRRAVAVAVGPASVANAPFTLAGAPTPFEQGGGAFTALTFGSRPPGGSWALRHPPAGFRWVGRYAAVAPQPQAFAGVAGGLPSASGGLPGSLVTEIDDVFQRGNDAIVLQQGSSINGATFAPPAKSDTVQLGGLGTGQLLYGATSSTVTAEPYGGKRFVRLSGTLPPDVLVALARSLQSQPSGVLHRLAGAAS